MSTQTKEEAEARNRAATRLAKAERSASPEVDERRANLPPHLQ